MSKRRVVITGLGPVAPNGTGKQAFWDALMAGRSGVTTIGGFDASVFPCRVAGEVSDFDADMFIDPIRSRRMARFTQLAVAAARLAVEDAGLDSDDDAAGASVGVCVGVSNNAIDVLEREYDAFLRHGRKRASPVVVGAVFPHAAASAISVEFGCQGPVSTISAGCASGAAALGQACEEIHAGRADVMLAGGTDGCVTPFTLASMCAVRMLPQSRDGEDPARVSRPFDRERTGGVLSEGAGLLVLESLEHALKRRACIYGEVLGYATNAEASAVFGYAPDDSFLERSMRHALSEARLRPADVDYISAHGPSDAGDALETRAIRTVFGERAYSIPVSSIKSMIGNPLAAAGPLQAISVALALVEQRVPPTINLVVPDPDCDLDYVPNHARVCRVNIALVNSHGLGGANHCMALGRYVPDNGCSRLPGVDR